jgi:Fur family transcriptional regulator, ferric uptake regulator
MDAQEHFNTYLKNNGVRSSSRRDKVFEVFIRCEKHVTVNELVALVHKKYPTIGIATVYRTLKLISESGIARAIEFGDGSLRYEHDYGHEHHDHLLCLECGAFREINSSRIEAEQLKIAKEQGFVLQKHKMVLYGLCPDCSKSKLEK